MWKENRKACINTPTKHEWQHLCFGESNSGLIQVPTDIKIIIQFTVILLLLISLSLSLFIIDFSWCLLFWLTISLKLLKNALGKALVLYLFYVTLYLALILSLRPTTRLYFFLHHLLFKPPPPPPQFFKKFKTPNKDQAFPFLQIMF